MEDRSSFDPPIRHTENIGWRLFYGLLCVAAWALFAWAWYVVFYKRTSDQTWKGVLALGIFLVFVLVVTLAWMRHNIRLHQRKEPRTIVPMVNEDWSHDHLGRPVTAEWSRVREASLVTIDVSDGRKVYSSERSVSS